MQEAIGVAIFMVVFIALSLVGAAVIQGRDPLDVYCFPQQFDDDHCFPYNEELEFFGP